MTRRIVDLPAPFVPSRASTSPLRTSNPTSNRICTWPYEKSTWLTWSAATWSGSAIRRSCSSCSSRSSRDTNRKSSWMNDELRRINNPPTIVDGTYSTMIAVRVP